MFEDYLEGFFSTTLTAMLIVLAVMFWGAILFSVYVGMRLLVG